MSTPAPIRRNDPCPCGSGRRYKDCHGSLASPAAPPSIDAQVRAALGAHQQGRLDDAERAYRQILSQEPGNAVATHYLGMIAWQRGDATEGERLMRESIGANATIPDFHNNLGMLLRDARRTADAVDAYRRTLAIDPGWYEAYSNLGLALEDAGRYEEALDAYAQALAREPRFAVARQNRARVLLTIGRFREGWEDYRWRLVAQGTTTAPPDLSAAPLPRDLSGRRIALAGEQGIGDVIFFLRFVPELARRGAEASFEGDARLYPMLERTGFFRGGLGVRNGEPVFVGDLPWLLQANDPGAFPPELPFSPLPERVAKMRERLEAAGPAPRVALTWRAGTFSTGPVRAQLKQVPPARLAAALRAESATWIGIQRLPAAGETNALAAQLGAPVHDFSDANEDLEDMLALLSVVDDYVGVSNANTHLRAALGGSMQVLVPFPPEWRWMAAGGVSPWFARMRVHRQDPDGSWDAAMKELAGA